MFVSEEYITIPVISRVRYLIVISFLEYKKYGKLQVSVEMGFLCFKQAIHGLKAAVYVSDLYMPSCFQVSRVFYESDWR